MKNSVFILFLLIPFFLCGQQVENRLNVPALRHHLKGEQIDSLFRLVSVLPDSVQLAIALVKEDSAHFFGIQKTEDKVELLENRYAVFEIGSITKVFTGALLARATLENGLSLDQKVRALLPVSLKSEPPITLKHLATHTSGLPRMPDNMGFTLFSANPFSDYSKDDLYAYLKERLKLDTVPGISYTYSNLGMGLLGQALVEFYDLPYEELVKKHITRPLNMEFTGISMTTAMDSLLVPGRNAVGKRVPNWTFQCMAPAGALRSNARDMVLFLEKQFQDTAFYRFAQQEFFSAGNNLSLGLAWHILKRGEEPVLFHNGGTGGYSSTMALYREKKTGLIVLSNCTAYFTKARNVDKSCLYLLECISER